MTQETKKAKYGYIKDQPDYRDHTFGEFGHTTFKLAGKPSLPTSLDFRKTYVLPIPFDQGNLGSCTANAAAFLYDFDEIKQKNQLDLVPSRLYIYYNTRMMEGTTSTDSGASIRDAIKSMNTYGICREQSWPYIISKFANKPPTACYTEGKQCKTVAYARVNQSVNDLKTALASGFPVEIGFTVYESFENIGSNGIMPYPKPTESNLGGHAVSLVGYDDTKINAEGGKGMFIVRNSWGPNWGDGGYFYMPYSIITNGMASDFWVVSKITNPPPSSVVPAPKPTPKPTPKPAPKPAPKPVPKKLSESEPKADESDSDSDSESETDEEKAQRKIGKAEVKEAKKIAKAHEKKQKEDEKAKKKEDKHVAKAEKKEAKKIKKIEKKEKKH